MLSGVVCAIPAICAARSIESPRAQALTYLAIPLMPCSARLPVHALLIAIVIPRETLFAVWLVAGASPFLAFTYLACSLAWLLLGY